MSGKVTFSSISDIARRAKVSKTTVSLVLNSKGHISEGTRRRVLRACDELQYRPHPTARFLPKLRGRTTDRIHTGIFGFTAILSDQMISTYSDFLDGVAEIAAARSKMVVFQPFKQSDLTTTTGIGHVSLDGRLLIGLVDDEQLDRFKKDGAPLVVMGDHECSRPVWNVNVDAYAAGQMAVNYLWGLGHRRVALVCQARDCNYQTELLRGFEDALIRRGVAKTECIILSNDLANQRYLESFPQQAPEVTAVVTITGGATLHALQKAKEAGLEVPSDLSLLHFGREERISSTQMLTHIDPVAREVGRLATELLVGLSEKGGLTPARTLLQPKLMEGETCRAI